MYKLLTSPCAVLRIEDGAFVPVEHPEYLAWLAEGNTPEPADPIITPIPDTITMRQCRLQLLADGDLSAVDGLVQAAGAAAQIEWQYGHEVKRDNVLFQAIAQALSKDTAAQDAFFTAASAL